MKILTWNINGIRSIKKDQTLKKLFDSLDADIICLQETKVTREMLEEDTAIVEGYNAYFSFSKVRSGYSGVATFCRNHVTPIKARDKIHLPDEPTEYNDIAEENALTNDDLESLNSEGRTVLTEHVDTEGNHVVIINLYCPRADLDNKERTEFKLKFYSLVEKKCKSLIQENKHVVVVGDFNVSHQPIDHCDPDDPEIFDSNPSRQWANTFISNSKNEELNAINSSNEPKSTTRDPHDKTYQVNPKTKSENTRLIDSFRYFHPNQKSAFTCWSTLTGARQTNYGTRIDYIFSSETLFKKEFSDCIIRPDIEGSDHCPVVATLKSTFKNSGKPPPLCTKYMPEFSGKQQKLRSFFKRKSETEERKTAEKRQAESTVKPQAKRTKTSAGASQGKIFHFFEKKNAKPNTHDSKQTKNRLNSANRVASETRKNAVIFEERPNADPSVDANNVQLRGSPNSSQETTSQSLSSFSENSTASSSSQNTNEKTRENNLQTHSEGQEKAMATKESSAVVISSWKNLLKGPPPSPLCSGHKEPCVLRTVKNKGPNHGKQFFCCARPQGHSTNKEARCNYFTWVKK